MPPEAPPWDRKDFAVRDRKNERGAALDGGAGLLTTPPCSLTPRWREQYHTNVYHSPSPRRPLTGHNSKHGEGYRQGLPDDTGSRGCTPSRSEDEGFRGYSGRYGSGGGGRSGSGRENRTYFRRSPLNSTDLARQLPDSVASDAQRSVAEPLTPASSQILPLKDHHDKISSGVDDGHGTGQRYDRERDCNHTLGPIAWKPLKWSRSGSFSSSTKSARSELDERGLESSHTGKEISSPVASPLASDEGATRKKQRLGWGQGLAKYEKQKVDGSEDCTVKKTPAQSDDSAKANLSAASPRLVCLAGSSSPATPSSATSYPSQDCKDKPDFIMSSDDGTCVIHDPLNHAFHNPEQTIRKNIADFSINLEHVGANSVSCVADCISTCLADIPQPEDSSSKDPNATRQMALKSLLPLKAEILKVLESTEGEIDSLENELKNLNNQFGKCLASLGSVHNLVDISSKLPEVSENVVHEGESLSFHSSRGCDLPTSKSCSVLHDILKHSEPGAKGHDVDKAESVSDEVAVSQTTEKMPSFKSCETTDSATVQSDGQFHEIAVDKEKIVCYCSSGESNCYDRHVTGSNPEGQCSSIREILSSNNLLAKKAMEAFHPVLPVNCPEMIAYHANINSDLHIRKKLAARKQFLRFKEQVLTFKHRAFYHLWKEDLRLISIKKNRSKSQKRVELSFRALQTGSQLLRSSIRSRFSQSGGGLAIVPTSEMADFSGQLFSDSNSKLYRNYLKMPPQILDELERKNSRFITNNGLIEDPVSVERELALVNPWTDGEKEEFLEKLANCGKDFKKIASFLHHKTTADCINFYYKNHKSESFAAVMKILARKKYLHSVPTNTYLLASGKKWKHEVDSGSLDMLGTASVIVGRHCDNTKVQPRSYASAVSGDCHDLKTSRNVYESCKFFDARSETAAADVLASISTALSSEGMSSCTTTSFEPAEKLDLIQIDRPLFSEVTQTIDEEDTCSDEGYGGVESADWTDEEKSILIRAVGSYGRDFLRISLCVGTKSREQCKIFFSKARKCLGLDELYQAGPVNDEKTPSDDASEGKSDGDDPCVVEIDSIVCNTQSCAKMKADSVPPAVNISGEELEQTASLAEIDPEIQNEEVQTQVQEKIQIPKTSSVDVEKILATCEEKTQSEANEDEVPTVALGTNESEEAPISVNMSTPIEIKSQGIDVILSALAPEAFTKDGKLGYPQHDSGDSKIKQEPCQIAGVETMTSLRQQSEACTNGDADGGSHQRVSDSRADGDCCHPGNKSISNNIDSPVTCQNPALLKMTPSSKSLSQISFWKEEDCSAPSAASVWYDYHQHTTNPTALNFEEHDIKPHHSSLSRDIYQQYCRQSVSRVNQPRHIVRGYPLPVLCKKEMIGDAALCGQRSVSMQNLVKKTVIPPSSEVFRDSDCEKPHDLRCGDLGLICTPKSNDPSDAHLMPCSRGKDSEPEHQPVRNGDIKLFGKSLIQPPSLPSVSSSHEIEGSQIGFIAVPEGMPTRTYGFWDV